MGLIFDFLFKECWARELPHYVGEDICEIAGAALETIGEIVLTSDKLLARLREAGESEHVLGWVTTMARAARRAHDFSRHSQPYLKDHNKDLAPVSQYVYDKAVLLSSTMRNLADGDLVIIPCRMLLSGTGVRMLILNIMKTSASKVEIIITDRSPESESYRDRVKGAFGVLSVDLATHIVSPVTHWRVTNPEALVHSSFWVLLLTLGSIPHAKAFYNLYSVLLPGVADRQYPDSYIATQPAMIGSGATSAWSTALLNFMGLAEHHARTTQRTSMLRLPAVLTVHTWDVLHTHFQQVISAAQEQTVPSHTISDITAVGTFLARALCTDIQRLQIPLASDAMSTLKSRLLDVADSLSRTRAQLDVGNPSVEVSPVAGMSPASPGRALKSLLTFCSFPLMGMFSAARHSFVFDASKLTSGGMTNRPDISAAIPLVTPSSSQHLVRCLDTLVRSLEAIELQKTYAKHYVWLSFTLIEEACVKIIPAACLTGAWPFTDLTAARKMGVIRGVREVLRYLALASARIQTLGISRLECVGVDGSVAVLAASLLVLQDVCLRQMPVDSVSPFTIVYGGLDSPRKNRSNLWHGAFCINLHGFADLSSLVPVLKPELLIFRLLVLDYLSKQNELRHGGAPKCLELFPFDLIGTAFGDHEVTFWLLLANVIGLQTSRSIEDQKTSLKELLNNDEAHIFTMVPEWHLLRDSVFMAKYLINHVHSGAPVDKAFTLNSAVPRWKPSSKQSADNMLSFRVSFLHKAGRNVTAAVAARVQDTGLNHFAPALKETQIPGVFTFSEIQNDLKKFWAQSAKGLPKPKEATAPNSFVNFTAISKYIQGFWDNQEDLQCTPNTSLLPGSLLSEDSPLPLEATTAVEQNNTEVAWQQLTSKVAETIRSETDILTLKAIPLLDKRLSHWDIEVLLQLLSVPFLRIPTLLAFFNHPERLMALSSSVVQHLLLIAIFEPGVWKNRHLKQVMSTKVVFPINFPCLDAWDEKFWMGTRMGQLVNEILFNAEGLVTILVDILRHTCDKDNGKVELSENEALKVLTFLTSLSCRILRFMTFLLRDVGDYNALGLNPPGSRDMFQINLKRLAGLLMKVLTAEVSSVFSTILEKAMLHKRVQLVVFLRSHMAEIQETYLSAYVDFHSAMRDPFQDSASPAPPVAIPTLALSTSLSSPHTEDLLGELNAAVSSPNTDDQIMATPVSSFAASPIDDMPGDAPDGSRADAETAAGGDVRDTETVSATKNILVSVAQNVFYVLAHRNFSYTESVFGSSAEVDRSVADFAESDSEDSDSGADKRHPYDVGSASVSSRSSGLAVYQLFLLLSRVRSSLVRICETPLKPWGDGYGKTFIPTEDSAVIQERSQLCDEILKTIVGSEDNGINTNVLGSWKRSLSCGWPSDLDAVEGTICGRYIRAPTHKNDDQSPAVEIDFQLGEVSFLSRGFQVLGDWVYKHKLFVDTVCGSEQKQGLFHCAILYSTPQITHYRLIGLQDFDVIRFNSGYHPMHNVVTMDQALANRQNKREELTHDLEGLKSQQSVTTKKSVESTLKKEIKAKTLALEAFTHPFSEAEGSLSPNAFLSKLWDNVNPASLASWKASSPYAQIPFFDCGSGAGVRRFVCFLDFVSRDSFKALGMNAHVDVGSVREIVYQEGCGAIEVFKFGQIGHRLFRTCVFSTKASLSLCAEIIRDWTRGSQQVWASGSLPVSNIFSELAQPIELHHATWGCPISRVDHDTQTETIWILKPTPETSFASGLFTEAELSEDLGFAGDASSEGLRAHLPHVVAAVEALRWINKKTTSMALCVDKETLRGLLPHSLVMSYDWWQRVPRICLSLEALVKHDVLVTKNFSRRLRATIMHCLQSRLFCELLCLLDDPFSELQSSPLLIQNSAEKDQISVYLPPPKLLSSSTCKWQRSDKPPITGWTHLSTQSIPLNLERFLANGEDQEAIIQRTLGGSSSKLTLLNPRALLSSRENKGIVDAILKLDDMAAVKFWSLRVPDMESVKAAVQETVRRRLSVIFLSQSLDNPKIASEMSPFHRKLATTCSFCEGVRGLISEISAIFEEKAQLTDHDIKIDLIELPRLGLTFRSAALLRGGSDDKLYSEQHDGFFISRREVSPASLTGKLLGRLAEIGVLLECSSGEFQVLVSGRSLPWALQGAPRAVPRPPPSVPLSYTEAWSVFNVTDAGISPHFVFKIHASRCFLYSSDGRGLLVLFLLRLATGEYEAAVRVLKSGSLVQYARHALTGQTAADDYLWRCIGKMSSGADQGHPDGIGCRLKALLAFGALGRSGEIADERNVLTKVASELRKSVLGDSDSGGVVDLLGWAPGRLYERYLRVLPYCAAVCRLSLKEESIILHYLRTTGYNISPLADVRLRLVKAALGQINENPLKVELLNAPMSPPHCAFDNVTPDAAQGAMRLWDSVQKVQGFVLTYRRPSTPVTSVTAVEYIVRLLLAKSSSAWSDLTLNRSQTAAISDISLSLSRDWLMLYDLLTNSLPLSVVPNEEPYQYGTLLSRFVSSADLKVPSRMAGCLRYLSNNKSFAISIAPKYDPNAVPPPDAAMSRVTNVTSRLGVTLRSEGPFKTLMEQLDEVLVSLPPQTMKPRADPPKDMAELRSIEIRRVELPALLQSGMAGMDQNTKPIKRRQLKTPDVDEWIQPLKKIDVCTVVDQEIKTRHTFELTTGRQRQTAAPLEHLSHDILRWNEQGQNKETLKLVFQTEETFTTLKHAAKRVELAQYLEQLRALLAAKFLSDGKEVEALTRGLMHSVTDASGYQESVVPRRILRQCGLEQTLVVENIIELLLVAEATEWLASHFGETRDEAEALLQEAARLMFVVNCRSQAAYCLASLSNICALVKASDEGDALGDEELKHLAARIDFHVDELATCLKSKRWYVHASGQGGYQCPCDDLPDHICYDPQYLVFEFANGIRLRRNQVELVDRISLATQPLCVQLMMGQGKTTVIGPLLATLLASPIQLVVQVVPNNLVHFTKRSLEERFAAVLKRPVLVLSFNRYTALSPELIEDLVNLQETRGVLVCSPTTIKSLFLKFVLLLSFMWNESFIRESMGNTTWRQQRQKALRSLAAFSKALNTKSHQVAASIKAPLGHAATQVMSVLDRSNRKATNRTLFGDIKTVMNKVGKIKFTTSPSTADKARVTKTKKVEGVSERELRANPSLLKSEFLIAHRAFHIFEHAVLIMDEVDTVLHPQKSELRWPVGLPQPVDLSDTSTLPIASHKAKNLLDQTNSAGARLLEGSRQMNGVRWRIGWHYLELVFIGLTRTHLTDQDISQACVCFDEKSTFMALEAETKSIVRGFRDGIRDGVSLKHCLTAPHFILLSKRFYKERLKTLFARWMAILLSYLGYPDFQYEEMVQMLIHPKDKFPAKWHEISMRPDAVQAINLSRIWVKRLGPHVLSCVHRVQYGLLRAEELAKEDRSALSRQLLAVPFVGKDTPSESSEFANADVLIGFTILAYRLEGLRLGDLQLTLENLKAQLRLEQARLGGAKSSDGEDRQLLPAAETYCQWIELAGGRVKGVRKSGPSDRHVRIDESIVCVLPLESVDLNDKASFSLIERLLLPSKLTTAYFLFNLAFPLTLKSSPYQLVASGQHLGSLTLFQRKVGFSGTPSSLLPPEFGECQFEEGSDGQMFSMLVSPDVTCCGELPSHWGPKSVLRIAAGVEVCGLPKQRYHALIDVGALVTGFSNKESAVILNEALSDDFVGVMFFGEGDQKMLMNKNLGGLKNIVQQDNSDVIPNRRFTFYDHTHAYGQDVTQDPLAVALLTVGKDTTFRDLAQGAWRLRQLGRGQRIHLVVPPEIAVNMRRRRMLWKPARAEPSAVERAINWCLWNAETQYNRLFQLASKQSCEHLIASLIVKTALTMDAQQLIAGPVAPLTGRLGELCVEGSRNELATTLKSETVSWRESIRQLMTQHNDLWNNPTVLSQLSASVLQQKADMIRKQLAQLDEAQMQALMKRETSKAAQKHSASSSALAAVFENELNYRGDDDDDSSVSSYEGSEQFDQEVEAEAEEELEEEEEQEEEIEKEEEHEVVNNEPTIIPGLKYSKTKEHSVPWTIMSLRDSISRGRVMDPKTNLVQFRIISEIGLAAKSGQPQKVNLSPSVWCTQNFHPHAWDTSLRRLRNVLFVLEIGVTTTREEANVSNSKTFQLLFHSLITNSEKPLTNNQFFFLLSLLGILDASNFHQRNFRYFAKIRSVINSLEAEKQWTLKETFRVLFMNYNLSLLGKYNTVCPVEVPPTSLFNKSIYRKFVCLTLREAQMVRRLFQEAASKSFSFSNSVGVHFCLRSVLNNFAILDYPTLEYEEPLSVQKIEAFASLRFLSGLLSLKPTEQMALSDLLAATDEITLKFIITENALRRRRLQIPSELSNALAASLTNRDFKQEPQAHDSAAQIRMLALYLKEKLHERSLTPESFVQELVAIDMKRAPVISPKVDADTSLIEEVMLPQDAENPTVGSILIWLILSGLPLSPQRLQNISLLLRTALNGSSVTQHNIAKLLMQR
eukprot:Blabericola_migrator_1__11120@NODE_64_length_15686_cov_41_644215_g57_i0_p1_GENE_NODE_64_length_15686_cov_41_644215_g57_i0NODE_64_length_15686_cov_41_644215_g57_i0_p1_ORF_typecomplete_len4495_score928_11DUF3638/PF12340_8/1_1e37DUF3638/PF12340_8/8e05DUF3645/PF12359_8/3_3e03DUF3645/PF12359_8/4_2e12Nop14/PF04147_12/0_00073SDA1/PF05285_12/2_4e03SDA1/PF05285_12/0_046AAA_11/PF13086_6/2_8AAA_11/PF13086_6/4_6e02MDM1/PF15501_6/8_1YL1/PF05764_13/18_NODE_64_length_15686_cov_41_644215_g57_i014513629